MRFYLLFSDLTVTVLWVIQEIDARPWLMNANPTLVNMEPFVKIWSENMNVNVYQGLQVRVNIIIQSKPH
jgi:hypothetical protein